MPNTRTLNPAEAAAEKARKKIFDCIDQRKSFLVEAGAGAGKTHSLISALRHLIDTQGVQLLRKSQRIACITYTNVATDEITSRTDRHPAVQPDTIHSFCWSAIRPFQAALRTYLPKVGKWSERLEEAKVTTIRTIDYNLGYPSIENGEALLHHNDVISLTVALLGEEKFRRVLADKYPVILIDEYQDTDAGFANAILTHFVQTATGPLIGFFGDHWQKIYGNGCGGLAESKLAKIGKEANFRSVSAIVNVLNKMRPELPQAVTNARTPGSASVYHTNAWKGTRQTGPHNKGDLPPEVSHEYLYRLIQNLTEDGWDFSPKNTKILMLTHKILAAEQGYRQLANLFERSESFIKKEDSHIAFFTDIVEPVSIAFEQGKHGDMFHALGVGRPAITSKADKSAWKKDMDTLVELRKKGTIGQVVAHLKSTKVAIPNNVQRGEDSIDDAESDKAARLRAMRDIPYSEVIALSAFIQGFTPFETKHGVKGAEFENVLVVAGRGWNLYDFNQFLEQLFGTRSEKQQASFERNRNLFYVACSRPKTNLAILFTQELSPAALSTLSTLFGKDAIHALPAMVAVD